MIIIAYKTDVWHTHASKEVAGVFTSAEKLEEAVRKRADFSEHDIDFLLTNLQTQGDSNCERGYELVIEYFNDEELDKLDENVI